MKDWVDDRLWLSLPVPAFLINAGNELTSVNPAAEHFLRASARQVLGQPVLDILAVAAPLEAHLGRIRINQAPVFVHGVDVGTGATKPVSCDLQLAPLSGDEGEVLMLLESRTLADRMGHSQSARNAAKSAIGMAEMLAHEIKNPLAGITGAAQLLSMGLSHEDRELTELIVAESRRIVALLDQVEQFGNLRPPKRQAVNLHDLLDRAKKSAAVGVAAHMSFVEDFDPSLPASFADGDQIVQVFMNLMKNAAEATKGKPGTITLRSFYDTTLRASRPEGSVSLPLTIEVSDDGPGIPPEIAQNMFDPFVSGRENGTGLGLALVSKIISDHDGWIAQESVPGRTVFRISLPLAPKEEL